MEQMTIEPQFSEPMDRRSPTPSDHFTQSMTNASDQASVAMKSLWGIIQKKIIQPVGDYSEHQKVEKRLLARLADITGDHYMTQQNTRKLCLKKNSEEEFGLDVCAHNQQRGLITCNINPGSIAYAAGVRNDEIVISVDGCNTLGADVDAVQSMLNVPHDDTEIEIILASQLTISKDEQSPKKPVFAKPPSYVAVKEALIKEFGEDAFNRSKRKVQSRLATLAERVQPESAAPPMSLANTAEKLKAKMAPHAAIAGEKIRRVASWMAERLDSLHETNDDENTAAADISRDTILDSQLRAKFLDICNSENPPTECQSVVSNGSKANIITLSYTGVREYLVGLYGDSAFERSKPWIRTMLQTKEKERKNRLDLANAEDPLKLNRNRQKPFTDVTNVSEGVEQKKTNDSLEPISEEGTLLSM
eukprot:m.124128 g.124128  ORF g.124128 m.124128 type:complete len:419 (+) comp14467_c0_seq4:110-1366(+)